MSNLGRNGYIIAHQVKMPSVGASDDDEYQALPQTLNIKIAVQGVMYASPSSRDAPTILITALLAATSTLVNDDCMTRSVLWHVC